MGTIKVDAAPAEVEVQDRTDEPVDGETSKEEETFRVEAAPAEVEVEPVEAETSKEEKTNEVEAAPVEVEVQERTEEPVEAETSKEETLKGEETAGVNEARADVEADARLADPFKEEEAVEVKEARADVPRDLPLASEAEVRKEPEREALPSETPSTSKIQTKVTDDARRTIPDKVVEHSGVKVSMPDANKPRRASGNVATRQQSPREDVGDGSGNNTIWLVVTTVLTVAALIVLFRSRRRS